MAIFFGSGFWGAVSIGYGGGTAGARGGGLREPMEQGFGVGGTLEQKMGVGRPPEQEMGFGGTIEVQKKGWRLTRPNSMSMDSLSQRFFPFAMGLGNFIATMVAKVSR
ncbi:unnamed protein product [Ilex paraguariensis]|uniref:Uncharacterized protein n=1 Tax=Ilex paraguariensis TaxID=185542 RepID=A0ABC8RH75_9AQUA